MERKVKQVILPNGLATINISGTVKSSLSISDPNLPKDLSMVLDYSEGGIFVTYTCVKTNQVIEQLIPNGYYSALTFAPVKKSSSKVA